MLISEEELLEEGEGQWAEWKLDLLGALWGEALCRLDRAPRLLPHQTQTVGCTRGIPVPLTTQRGDARPPPLPWSAAKTTGPRSEKRLLVSNFSSS
jgi:hypothetical protein